MEEESSPVNTEKSRPHEIDDRSQEEESNQAWGNLCSVTDDEFANQDNSPTITFALPPRPSLPISISKLDQKSRLRIAQRAGLTPEGAIAVSHENDEEAKNDDAIINKFQMPTENQVTYSPDQINVSNEPDQEIFIPKKGTFRAGDTLREEFADELNATLIDGLIHKKGVGTTRQFKKDLDRASNFSITDTDNGSYSINFPPSPDYKKEHEVVQVMRSFLGSKNYYIMQAILVLSNQTLGNSITLLLAFGKRPSFKETLLQKPRYFSTDGTIGFAVGSLGNSAKIEYDLKHERDECFLEFNSAGKAVSFFIKQSDSRVPYLTEIEPDALNINHSSVLKLRFLDNHLFDPKKPISIENAPCHIECLEFYNEYQRL